MKSEEEWRSEESKSEESRRDSRSEVDAAESSVSFLRGLVEATIPAAASVAGMAASAGSYDAASSASVASQIASVKGIYTGGRGVDFGALEDRAAEHATAFAATTLI